MDSMDLISCGSCPKCGANIIFMEVVYKGIQQDGFLCNNNHVSIIINGEKKVVSYKHYKVASENTKIGKLNDSLNARIADLYLKVCGKPIPVKGKHTRLKSNEELDKMIARLKSK